MYRSQFAQPSAQIKLTLKYVTDRGATFPQCHPSSGYNTVRAVRYLETPLLTQIPSSSHLFNPNDEMTLAVTSQTRLLRMFAQHITFCLFLCSCVRKLNLKEHVVLLFLTLYWGITSASR